MPAFTLGGLFNKLRPPAEAGSDAALLRRFVQTRDAEAFAEIVRRHGAMVLAVGRRVLGDGPDAEDAHQIAFMALARDAGKIDDPQALGGWLYRVAWLTARKLAGRVHRRKPEPLVSDPAITMPSPPDNDVRAVIDEELLGLPERFRAVAVLCLVEGRTNTEAAGLLGIPKGTVDSRLSTAKQKLRERLLRRGIAAAALLSVEQWLTSETSAAPTRAVALAANAITVALDYAAGVSTAGTEHLIHTANGVRPVTNSLKWLAALMFTTALIGGGGVGVAVATAGDKPTPAADAKAKADPKNPADPKQPAKPADKPGELTTDKKAEEKNPVEWTAGTVTLKAADFGIEANGTAFTSKGQKVTVRGDPGNATYKTLELTWDEGGVEMRVNLYLKADAENWWVQEARTYNGKKRGDWVTYKGPLCKSPLGKPFKGDVDLATPPGANDPAKLKLGGLELTGF